jgi:hypothetical protein
MAAEVGSQRIRTGITLFRGEGRFCEGWIPICVLGRAGSCDGLIDSRQLQASDMMIAMMIRDKIRDNNSNTMIQ